MTDFYKFFPVRRFKGSELADLVGVWPSMIYNARAAGYIPNIETDDKGRKLGCTHEQLIWMQRVFGTTPSLPDDQGLIITFANFHKKSGKTLCAWHAASYYALKGYNVLLVDLDPSATLSTYSGARPDIDTSYEKSLTPFLLSEKCPIDSMQELKSLEVSTPISTLKLIPSSMMLTKANFPTTQDLNPNVFDELKKRFDIVIIDSETYLTKLKILSLKVADLAIVPVAIENPRPALGFLFNMKKLKGALRFPEFAFLPVTRHNLDSRKKMEALSVLRKIFSQKCFEHHLTTYPLWLELAEGHRNMFDVNRSDLDPKSRKELDAARISSKKVFEEVLNRVRIIEGRLKFQ